MSDGEGGDSGGGAEAADHGDRAGRRSLTEEATELVEAVRTWSADPAVRTQLATAATSLLEAGAALLDTVAERQRRRQGPAGPPAPDPEGRPHP